VKEKKSPTPPTALKPPPMASVRGASHRGQKQALPSQHSLGAVPRGQQFWPWSLVICGAGGVK